MLEYLFKYGDFRNKLSVTYSTNTYHFGRLLLFFFFQKKSYKYNSVFQDAKHHEVLLALNARIYKRASSLPVCNTDDLEFPLNLSRTQSDGKKDSSFLPLFPDYTAIMLKPVVLFHVTQ